MFLTGLTFKVQEAIQQALNIAQRLQHQQIEQAKIDEKRFERVGDLNKVAEIRYGTLVNLQKELQKQNDKLTSLRKEKSMLKEEVDDEDIAEIVSKWTGIPLSKLMEAEQKSYSIRPS